MKFKSTYLKELINILLLIIIVNVVVTYINFKSFFTYNNNRVESIVKTNGPDLNLICNIVNCEYISKNKILYSPVNDVLKETSMNINNLSIIERYIYNRYTIQDTNIHIVPKLDNFYIFSIREDIVIALLILLGYHFYYFKSKFLEEKNKDLEMFINKSKLEGRLQNITAESAYHEMTVPVEVIKTSIMQLKETTPSVKSMANISKNSNCYTCKFRLLTQEYTDYFPLLDSNIERLESVLEQMSTNKKTKYNVNSKDLYDIILTTIKSLKLSHFSFTFDYEIKNQELLKSVKASKLDNGTLLNILNNQIKNSLEAGATTIVVDSRYDTNSKILSLILTDNGSGIKNVEDGDYDKIFQLGYSTKEEVQENMKAIDEVNNYGSFKTKIMKFFNKDKNKKDEVLNSYRGFGLYITREILRDAGGDIYVYTTSNKGTVFIIDLLVNSVKESK